MYTRPEEKLGCGVEGEARDQFLWQLKTGCGFVGSVEGLTWKSNGVFVCVRSLIFERARSEANVKGGTSNATVSS